MVTPYLPDSFSPWNPYHLQMLTGFEYDPPLFPICEEFMCEDLTTPVVPDKDVNLAKSLPAMLGTECSLDFFIY